MKKALLVGINYTQSDDNVKLQGCIDDVLSIQKMLINDLGYKKENIIMLKDNILSNKNAIPTGKNIITKLIKCVNELTPKDEFWFHYSGHGSQIKDDNNEETDNKDEVIIPSDYKEKGVIRDDFFRRVINQINCRAFLIFDCCNSGTVCDLPYNYDLKNKIMQQNKENKYDCPNNKIFKLSGCRDDQVSLSILHNETKKMKGACTTAFIESMKQTNYDITFEELIIKMHKWMNKYSSDQCPTLSSTSLDALQTNFNEIILNITSTPIKTIETYKNENNVLQKEVDLLKRTVKSLQNDKKHLEKQQDMYKRNYNYIRTQYIKLLIKRRQPVRRRPVRRRPVRRRPVRRRPVRRRPVRRRPVRRRPVRRRPVRRRPVRRRPVRRSRNILIQPTQTLMQFGFRK